jgi:4'-phosphopantetheinyl transferase
MIEVDVWSAPLDVDEPTLMAMERTLSADERAHARGILDPLTRWRWVADHGWRRRLLGELLDCDPVSLAYTVNAHGRPDVAGSAVSFSASRSQAGAVYAVSWDAVVGVDVEVLRDGVDVDAFARRFFTPAERAALAAVDAGSRNAACFACWSRKEAYAKAAGTGLVFPLTEVEVWAGDDRPTRWGDHEIHALALGDERVGALAARGRGPDARQIRVSPFKQLR